MTQTTIEQALDLIPGGQTALAKALKIDRSMVSQWVTGRKPIAPRHCPVIEKMSGVRCEQLRPDLIWTRGNDGVVTGHHVPITAPQVDGEAA